MFSDDDGKPKIPEDMDIDENTECNFNVDSFKMVYVVNSEGYLYKRNALTRAKKVGTITNILVIFLCNNIISCLFMHMFANNI